MTAIEKLRAKQRARLAHIKAADAHSKLFFLQANGRKRKNFIQKLVTPEGMVYSHLDKQQHIVDHFSDHFGQPVERTHTLNWELLGLQRLQLISLEEPFSDDETHVVIIDLTSDKAPGPDGFIGVFFQICLGHYQVRSDASCDVLLQPT
jgi:hypothetical protein